MDYGQETYEFGSSTQDARHFDKYVLKVLQEDAEILSELFNSEKNNSKTRKWLWKRLFSRNGFMLNNDDEVVDCDLIIMWEHEIAVGIMRKIG